MPPSVSRCYKKRQLLVLSLLILGLFSPLSWSEKLPNIKTFTQKMEAMPGLVDLYWQADKGKMYMVIDQLEQEFIYQVSLASGLGSNPVGLDRGKLGHTFVLRAEKIGQRILFIESNNKYRAISDNPLERSAVIEAFAPAVQWSFDIIASSGKRYLVDASDYFLRDTKQVINSLKAAKQGKFELDPKRSYFYLPRTRSFKDNTEVEVSLTFSSQEPGELVNMAAANGHSLSLRQHHSFIKAPSGYHPRKADARIGTLGISFQDYGSSIEQDLTVRWVGRHRLEKKNPEAKMSEAVKPIVYYLDSGTPEPVRSALIEGAMWWNSAFEAAGFINAFQVKLLPEGVDPMDARYNMIHWTHRRTRGYSYGNFIMDPRTGEILKGNVNLGSLRLRQDYLHGKKLLGGYSANNIANNSSSNLCQLSDAPSFDHLSRIANSNDKTAVAMALARVRQLSAHEVGHTLGLAHNFLASSYGRESVMDYPAPLIKIKKGKLDLSEAYRQQIGLYDKLSVRWLYGQFDTKQEADKLNHIVQQGLEQGLVFLNHPNNNFREAAHPAMSVWDNGSNLVDQLLLDYQVREIALQNFGQHLLRPGEPLSHLEAILLPTYMHHRFQLNAAAQSIGGADYRYAHRGDGQFSVKIVDAAEQRRALDAVLQSLSLKFLRLPKAAVEQIPPPAKGFEQAELFAGRSGLVFDQNAVIEASVGLTVEQLLRPKRLQRIQQFSALGDYPTVTELIDKLLQHSWYAKQAKNPQDLALQTVIKETTLNRLLLSTTEPSHTLAVRGVLNQKLAQLATRLEKRRQPSALEFEAARQIRQSQEQATIKPSVLNLPPGDPI